MYRSTGCRWAHGWIFLASPSSSILLSLYCFSYSRTCARCILYLILLHNPSKRRLQHRRSCELRGSKSRILQFTTLRLSKPFHPSNRLRLPTLPPLLRDRVPALANHSIHLEPPSTRYLYIGRIVIFNPVINTRLIYRANALLFFPRLFFAPLHQRERKLSNTFTLFHPSIYSLGARTRYSTASDTLFKRGIRRNQYIITPL
jgi:hypothetical protein